MKHYIQHVDIFIKSVKLRYNFYKYIVSDIFKRLSSMTVVRNSGEEY